MVPADQPAMKQSFNVDHEHQLATENWLKTTLKMPTPLWIIFQVRPWQNFDRMITMFRLVWHSAILALIGMLPELY